MAAVTAPLPGEAVGVAVPTLAVEAASPDRWYSFADDVVGTEGFGASPPTSDFFMHFGFAPPNFADRTIAISRGART